MSGACSKCKSPCVFKESRNELFGYPCDICKGVICKGCYGVRLSATEIRAIIMPSRIIPFFCPDCVSRISHVFALEQDVSNLKTEVNEMKEQMEESSKKSYADALKIYKQESEQLKSEINKIEQKVNTPKLDVNQGASNNIEPTIFELQERERRATNVMLFGMEENTMEGTEERIREENIKVKDVLKRINIDVEEANIKIHRIGKFDRDKKRPIRIMFPSKEEALLVLKRRNQLNVEGVYIKGDQTPAQRSYVKALTVELRERASKGEKDLRIKYINSVPRIIKLKDSAKN